MLTYIGGIAITPLPRNAPSRTDEPPGTMRTPSARSSRLSGSVSLSKNGQRPWSTDASDSAPCRKPSRMPCFTHTFTRQPVGAAGVGLGRAHLAGRERRAQLGEDGAGVLRRGVGAGGDERLDARAQRRARRHRAAAADLPAAASSRASFSRVSGLGGTIGRR